MEGLESWQYATIAVLFVWSGFVRSGLGFGGAVLSLPFLLMVYNAPLVFLPIISVHLLFFSLLTVVQSHLRSTREEDSGQGGTVNWAFLRYALPLMIIPKLIGVAGVITLPADIVSGFIFIVVSVYSLTYILDRPFRSNSKTLDAFFLLLGGYVSGTSLIAAPLVVPVAASRITVSRVDLQWQQHLWLLPCAAVGHVIGLRFHSYTLRADTKVFFRVLGAGLLLVSLAGLARLLWDL
jgi:uncharacterized membrane protein YfcA